MLRGSQQCGFIILFAKGTSALSSGPLNNYGHCQFAGLQDWMNKQFDDLDSTVSDVYLGQTWLRQMGNGAARAGLTIQYCMSPSRSALQSLEIPVVSQVRTEWILISEESSLNYSHVTFSWHHPALV